jgi:hypothetical protein
MQNFAGRTHHLGSENIGCGCAVLHRSTTAGVLRYVATDEADILTHRVTGEKQPVGFQLIVEGVGDNSRLHGHHQVFRVDIDNPVHFFKTADHAAGNGYRRSGQAASRSPGSHRCARLVGPLHQRHHLGGTRWKYHRVRRLSVVVISHLVDAIALGFRGIHEYVIAENLLQSVRVGHVLPPVALFRRSTSNGPSGTTAHRALAPCFSRR